MIGRAIITATALLALSAGTAGAQETGQPWPWQWNFQAAASPTMERIAALTLTLNLIIVLIVVFITAIVGYIVWRFRASKNPVPARWSHNTTLEIAWTTIPVLILVAIAFPSFHLLYYMDRTHQAEMTLKVTGHQWYWSYEYPDHKVAFDSVLVDEANLKPGQLRLLTVDNPLVLPVGVAIRVQMTADDVIHSWAVPAFGIKTDTVPGRLNETWVQITKPGTYYGQCSELCGINHGYMPVMVKAVPREEFQAWLKQARLTFPSTSSDLAQAAQ